MTKLLKNFVFDGVLLIVLGLVFVIWPRQTAQLFCRIFGIVLIVMGAISILEFLLRKEDRSAGSLILGIIQAAAGACLVARPGFFLNFIPYVAGLLVGVGAVVGLIHAIKTSKEGSRNVFSIVLCVVTLALAALLIFHPGIVASSIMVWIGIALIVEGVTLLASMSR